MLRESPTWMVISQKAGADIGLQALIPSVVLTALAAITVALRCYSRSRFSGKCGVEDMYIIVALVSSIAYTALVSAEYKIDFGNTYDELRLKLEETMMKLIYAQSITYHVAVNFVRLSLVAQYFKLFAHIRRLHICLYVVCCITLGTFAWGVLGTFYHCRPICKYWDPGHSGTCMSSQMLFWSCAIMGIVLDVTIWMLPMPMLGRLSLGRRQKVQLLIPFGLGLFVCIVATLRLVLVHTAAVQRNITKSGTHAVIWSTTEVNVAIICSSLLVMKPLLARLIPCWREDPPATASEEDCTMRRMMAMCNLEAALAGDVPGGVYDLHEDTWSSDDSDVVRVQEPVMQANSEKKGTPV